MAERKNASGGGAEREGDTGSEAGSRLRAVSTEPDAGLELTDCKIMTWAEVGRLTDWATQARLPHVLNATITTNDDDDGDGDDSNKNANRGKHW